MNKIIILFTFLQISLSSNSQELTPFTQNYKVGYKDKNGKIVVPNIYEAGSEFENGYAIILVDRKRGYLNEKGQVAIEPQYQDASLFHYGLAAVRKDNLYGYINPQNEWVIKNTFQNAFDFIEGVARVQINNKWGLINTQGKIFVPAVYEEIYDCSQGLILVKDFSGFYGYMNPKGEWAIKPQFKEATPFIYTGLAMIRKEGKLYHINTQGNITGEVEERKEEWEREREEKEQESNMENKSAK